MDAPYSTEELDREYDHCWTERIGIMREDNLDPTPEQNAIASAEAKAHISALRLAHQPQVRRGRKELQALLKLRDSL